MYNRILVAFDASPAAQLAMAQALTLAKAAQAAVRAVHVVDIMFPASPDMVYMDLETYRRDRVLAGQQVLDQAAEMGRRAGVDVETRLLEVEGSRYSNAIIAEAKRWPADLIVLGTHGRSAIMHLLMGSVAQRVVRHAPVPVLLVPVGEKPA